MIHQEAMSPGPRKSKDCLMCTVHVPRVTASAAAIGFFKDAPHVVVGEVESLWCSGGRVHLLKSRAHIHHRLTATQ